MRFTLFHRTAAAEPIRIGWRPAGRADGHDSRPQWTACRVLELGCGGGANLLAMALLAAGQLSSSASTRQPPTSLTRRYLRRNLGRENLTLSVISWMTSLTRLPFRLHRRSWRLFVDVAPVREPRTGHLRINAQTEQGIAFVSYTVYPGRVSSPHGRRKELYHAPESDSLRDQLGRARDLLTFLADAMPQPERYREILREEKGLLETLRRRELRPR